MKIASSLRLEVIFDGVADDPAVADLCCSWLGNINLYCFSGRDGGDSFVSTVFRWAKVARCAEHACKVLLGSKPTAQGNVDYPLRPFQQFLSAFDSRG
jgi:hypothetical protein